MYSVLVCRWLQEINHKMSITQPFKKSDSEWNPKTKDTFSQWLLAACSLIWPCSAILKSTQHACILVYFCRGLPAPNAYFFGGTRRVEQGEDGGRWGRWRPPKWEEVAHLFSFGLVTQLRCSKLGYTISHMGPIWTHMFHFSDVSFLTTFNYYYPI